MTQEKTFSSTKETWKFFLNSINDHKVKISGIFIGDALQAIYIVLLPFVVKDLIDAVESYAPDAGQSIWVVIKEPFTYFIAVNIALVLFSRISGTFLGFTAPFFGIMPRRRLVEHLQKHAFNYFQDSHSGSLGNKIHQTIIGMRLGLWTFVFEIWPTVLRFSFSVFLMFYINVKMGIILAVWSLFYFSVVAWIGLIKYNIVTRLSHERSHITGIVVDIASNIHAVKSFANEDHEKENIDKAMKGEIHENTTFQFAREGMGWFYSIMTTGLMFALIVISFNEYAAQHFTIGEIAFVVSLLLLLMEQSRGLTFTFSRFLEYLGQMRDGVGTVMRTHTLEDAPNAKPLKIKSGKADIALKDVFFSYSEDPSEAVFESLNLNIPAGQKIGLVGTSGAGKSTLASLLLRFYDIDKGKITIAGKDIAKLTQHSLRKHIAVIPQDTALFHRSLMENIRYGNLGASDEDVIKAAKKAHAHDFIKDLPDQYQTMVGERGVKLSGGQRQRIAIARAILKDAPILILDEATSALDSESEALIQDSLSKLMKGKTVIAIAHRLSTIAKLDRLLVMQKGKIIEDGTHNELLKKKGYYARLWAMQSGGFLKEKG